jgi:hypothetical protein
MATVANLGDAGDFSVVDPHLCDPNRVTGADPNGALTPAFAGEIVLDTTNKKLWQAQDLTNTHWVEFRTGMYTGI